MSITKRQKDIIRKGSYFLFLIYMAVMVYFLFFSEGFNRTEGNLYQYNLDLFREIERGFWYLEQGNVLYFVVNVVLNVVAFMPFGFILPIITPKNWELFPIFLVSLEMTLAIELLQMVFQVGIFDVDDIFMNTLGGMLGYILYEVCYGLLKRWIRRGGKNEWQEKKSKGTKKSTESSQQ